MPDVLMPRLSDTMSEGVLSQWLKKEGDPVHKGDVLAEIETDKAVMELEAYDDGVLERQLVPAGTTVPIGQPIAVIGDGRSVPRADPTPEPSPVDAPPVAEATAPVEASARVPAAPVARVRTSPLARLLARDHGIDLSTVTGTGPGGRVVRADVQALIDTPMPAVQEIPPIPAQAGAGPAAPGQVVGVTGRSEDEAIPLTAIQRVTARRLTESAGVPHFFITGIVDVSRLLELREQASDRLAADDIKISINDLLIRACAVTLRAHPVVNASWGGDTLIRHHRIDIGIAVAVPDGLVVPVLRSVDRMSLREIALAARDLSERARAGKLTLDELSGGTFTISNLGMFGVDNFAAVINPPEAAILAVGAATPQPVAHGSDVVVRPMMKITLTADHRVLDGASAALFLRDLELNLTEPLRVLL